MKEGGYNICDRVTLLPSGEGGVGGGRVISGNSDNIQLGQIQLIRMTRSVFQES